MTSPVFDPAAFYLKDYVTIAALAFGPVAAVIITLWYQQYAEKRAAKMRLFVSLMGHRKSVPIAPEWVNSLNLIDVVYADYPKVVERWHVLYDVFQVRPWNAERYAHASLELLSEMAKSLGYKNLAQTDIDKFYVPEAHTQVAGQQNEVLTEFLRVLKATETMREIGGRTDEAD